jgi:hypothetical protein
MDSNWRSEELPVDAWRQRDRKESGKDLGPAQPTSKKEDAQT